MQETKVEVHLQRFPAGALAWVGNRLLPAAPERAEGAADLKRPVAEQPAVALRAVAQTLDPAAKATVAAHPRRAAVVQNSSVPGATPPWKSWLLASTNSSSTTPVPAFNNLRTTPVPIHS